MKVFSLIIFLGSFLLSQKIFAFDAEAFAKDVDQTQIVDCDSMMDYAGSASVKKTSTSCGGRIVLKADIDNDSDLTVSRGR